jgi:hypothetical protein
VDKVSFRLDIRNRERDSAIGKRRGIAAETKARVAPAIEDLRRLVVGCIEHCNTRRLRGAISFVTPEDKLEAARAGRRQRRQASRVKAERGATEKGCHRPIAGAYC